MACLVAIAVGFGKLREFDDQVTIWRRTWNPRWTRAQSALRSHTWLSSIKFVVCGLKVAQAAMRFS